ncbi:MAG: exopolysaccharide Pel transporter PelG [Thermoplasmata archaeon]
MSTRDSASENTDPILIDSIARTVSEVEGHPKGYLEVAVILEILGYSDKDAREMGFRSVFDLARATHESVSRFSVDEGPEEIEEPKENTLILFFAGMFYNLGWMIMLLSLFLGGQSLWAAKDLPTHISTGIGMGVLLGLISTGGIQQFTAWKLIYYQMQGNKPLARFIMERNLIVGSLIILGTFAIFLAINAIALSLPIQVILITLYFLTLIGIYRLFAAPVFAFRRFKALLFISVSALVVMFASYFVLASFGMERVGAVITSQSLGLAVLIFSSAYFTHRYIFSEREEKDEDEPPFYSRPELPKKVKAPRYWVLGYEGIPIILHGTLYFVFIFGDRLVSWFGAGPMMISYNRTYQIGVDLALLLLIPITGVKFTYLFRMSNYLERNLKKTDMSDCSSFSIALKAFYKRMVVGVTVFGGLFVLIAFLAGDWFVGIGGGNAESATVFKWALLGIFFFSLFLTNSVFSFCFRKNKAIVVVLALGCVLAYSLSYIFSTVSQWYSVFGFVLSSFFLMVTSFFVVFDMLRKADYTYYQAF